MAETILKGQEKRACACTLAARKDDVSAVFVSQMYDETKLALRVVGSHRELSVLASRAQLHVQH
eukprot:10608174-Prorocentrum_lima.AAC.1